MRWPSGETATHRLLLDRAQSASSGPVRVLPHTAFLAICTTYFAVPGRGHW